MTTDDIPEPDDPAFEINRDDYLLNTVRTILALTERTASFITTLLWPFFAIENILLFLAMPITWVLSGWLPYAYHAFHTTIRAIAFLGVPLALGALIEATIGFPAPVNIYIDAGVATTQALLTTLQTTPYALAVALTAYYLVAGLLPYEPLDIRSWRTFQQPDPPSQWELTLFTIIALSQITLLVVIREYSPSILSLFPYGITGLAGLTIVASYLMYRYVCTVFTTHYHEHDDGDVHLELDSLLFCAKQDIFVVTLGLVGILAGAFELLNQSLTDVLLYAHLLSMWWLSRQFRWVLYEDRDGFINVNPHSKLWTLLHRTPLAYALILTAVGGLSLFRSAPYAFELSTVPLLAILAYYPFRYYQLNGNMYKQFPRSLFDPDERDFHEYVRERFFNYEQQQMLRPENQLETQLFRVRSRVKEAAQQLLVTDRDHFGPMPIPASILVGLRIDEQSTYESRQEKLETISDGLRVFREKLETYEGDNKAELIEHLDTAAEAVEKAQELNEEVGERKRDTVTDMLF